MEIKEQKVLADEVLKALSDIDSDCLLVGGAPRDWTLGKSARDLDFYFHVETDEALGALLGLYRKLDGLELVKESGEIVYEKVSRDLAQIYWCKYKGVEVQLMRLSKPVKSTVVETFSTSICEAWYKDGEIYTTDNFKLGIKTKTMWLEEKFNWSDPHPMKMKDRFSPEFECVQSKEDAIKKLINS